MHIILKAKEVLGYQYQFVLEGDHSVTFSFVEMPTADEVFRAIGHCLLLDQQIGAMVRCYDHAEWLDETLIDTGIVSCALPVLLGHDEPNGDWP